MNQVLYGVGTMVFKDYAEPSKVLMMAKLQNVVVKSATTEEDVFGGDSTLAFTSFPTSQEITMSARNAEFNLAFVDASQGSDVDKGAVTFIEPLSMDIPAGGVVDLTHTPVADSLAMQTAGYTVVSTAPTEAGQVYLDVAGKQVAFHTDDAGKQVEFIYEWLSSNDTVTSSITKESINKPFTVIHRIPIYEDGVATHEMQITIHKAKVVNGFEFNFERQKAFAPNLELKALDSGRPDKKLWSVSITPVA